MTFLEQFINISYIVASIIFIYGLKMLGRQESAAAPTCFQPSAC